MTGEPSRVLRQRALRHALIASWPRDGPSSARAAHDPPQSHRSRSRALRSDANALSGARPRRRPVEDRGNTGRRKGTAPRIAPGAACWCSREVREEGERGSPNRTNLEPGPCTASSTSPAVRALPAPLGTAKPEPVRRPAGVAKSRNEPSRWPAPAKCGTTTEKRSARAMHVEAQRVGKLAARATAPIRLAELQCPCWASLLGFAAFRTSRVFSRRQSVPMFQACESFSMPERTPTSATCTDTPL